MAILSVKPFCIYMLCTSLEHGLCKTGVATLDIHKLTLVNLGFSFKEIVCFDGAGVSIGTPNLGRRCISAADVFFSSGFGASSSTGIPYIGILF